MQIEDGYRNAPVLMLMLNQDLVIDSLSDAAVAVLGECRHCAIDAFADAESAMELGDLMRTLSVGGPPASRVLCLRRCDGECIAMSALVDKIRCGSDEWMRITALYDPGAQQELAHLARSEEVHRRFVETSPEAMWCIEFSEPVDLTLGEHETIRQVFENDCHWMMCNASMARLYNLPDGLDFNRQPVSHYFPRTPENEAFIRQIIGSDFSVANAPSIDMRHDGSAMYVENTVHCHIRNGRMFRMWGSVRDVTGYRQVQNRLAREAQDVRSVLNAIPDAVLVIDREHRLLAVNTSFETLLGWKSSQFLGRDIRPIIDLEAPLPGGRRWYGVDRQQWSAEVRTQSGRGMICDVQSAPVGDEAPDQFVLMLRPARKLPDPFAEHAKAVIPMPVQDSVWSPR